MSVTNNRFISFAAVKAAVAITRVMEHYDLLPGFRPLPNGDGHEGPCPIHQSAAPDDFKISVSKNCWNCFGGCGRGGNVLDFVALMEGVPVQAAAHKLNEWFALGLVEERPPGRRPQAAARPRQAKSAPPLNTESKPPAPKAVPAPVSKQPVEQPLTEAVANAPLKFELKNLDTGHPYFAALGVSPDTVAAFGLGYCAKGTMSGRIAIPLHNGGGELLGYCGRWPGELPEGTTLHKFPAAFSRSLELFNLHRALGCEVSYPLIVVPWFFDAVRVFEAGYPCVVALMGTNLSAAQEILLLGASRHRPGIILFLPDDEGEQTEDGLLLPRLAARRFVRCVRMPSGAGNDIPYTIPDIEKLLL